MVSLKLAVAANAVPWRCPSLFVSPNLPARVNAVGTTSRHFGTTLVAHKMRCAASFSISSDIEVPELSSLELLPVLDDTGNPVAVEESPAVFGVFDKAQVLQYVGFSANLSKSLQTLFFRRPEVTYFYKTVVLEEVNQEVMLDIRNRWFERHGGPPLGNKNPAERDAWQNVLEVKSNTEQGVRIAAEEMAAVMLTQIRNRGCKLEIVADPTSLIEGKVEFVALTPEEIERIRKEREKIAARTRTLSVVVDGKEDIFELFVEGKFKTNGGYMFDVTLTHESRRSNHRVIVGEDYFCEGEFEPELALDAAFAFLLQQKIPRQTEGVLASNQISANYFSIAEMHQHYSNFEEFLPHHPNADTFWRFNRTQDYGYKGGNEDPGALSRQFEF